jgi:hypothetical protein
MQLGLWHSPRARTGNVRLNSKCEQIHADHETRLRALERFRFTLGGLAVVGGAVAGWVGYVLGHFVH